MVKFKDFSRPLSVFQVLFKAFFIFKDFSRQSCIFKYFSMLCEPCAKFVQRVSILNLTKDGMRIKANVFHSLVGECEVVSSHNAVPDLMSLLGPMDIFEVEVP